MDSPRFRRLCFLLLTIATPHANIAMPSGNPAERTQDTSSGKMHVVVYYCEDCEISACEPSNYEGFDVIHDTQNKTFLNKVIKLEINETNISMCFQQENTSYKGIYAIWWRKDVGIGDSCGIVDYGASSENMSGKIAKICCAAETNYKEPRRSLKCYTSGEEPPTRKPTVIITDEEDLGYTQPVMGGNDSIGIITTVLFLGVCAAVLIVFRLRRNQNGQGPVMLIQQFFDAAGNKNLVPDIEGFAPFWKKTYK
ncbi:uncharacterized protein isoform X1 [Numenius arquata]|uniref:uncharacterized protein isoform X1 n=1 Tax=Numenius arquata TaxID=31919 RepID=UPI003D306AAB